MGRRLMRVRSPLLMGASATPLGVAALWWHESALTSGQTAALTAAGFAGAAGLIWLAGAYVSYRWRRRRFQHILVAEGAAKRRWLPVRTTDVVRAPAVAQQRTVHSEGGERRETGPATQDGQTVARIAA